MQLVFEGWLLGLASGPYCLGACAPFMVPYLFAQGSPNIRKNTATVFEFLLGRLLAYLIVGALSGWIGDYLSNNATYLAARAALVITSILLIIYALTIDKPSWRMCFWESRKLSLLKLPIVMGFLIGVNICPPFLVAVSRVLELGGILSGAIFFFAFFAGSALYALPLIGLSPFIRFERMRRIGVISSVIVGIWFLIYGILGL